MTTHLDPAADLATHFVVALPLLALGRLLVRDGRPDEARGVLERAAEAARSGAGRLERVATSTELARLLDRAGDRPAAERLRSEATALLRLSARPGRASVLLAGTPSAPRIRIASTGDELTAREAAVLQLLPTRLTLREIADNMFVSHNTVKTHARTLYRKLGVSTRDEAVAAARSGGLLRPT